MTPGPVGSGLDRRQGAALIMVLAVLVLVGSLTLVTLRVALIRSRLVADTRWRVEGQLIAATALAATRLAHRAELDTISDGAVLAFPPGVRPDGWTWQAEARRTGVLIRIITFARHTAGDGTIHAARRASLMLARDPADTVRVLARRARF